VAAFICHSPCGEDKSGKFRVGKWRRTEYVLPIYR